ncbi:MAG: hypothetical protein AUI36_22500 [Cyanobacteria bacterium 13_1_40CM_2_61_4]|nr:MAG: hypothetical protein AUI36_22500 [Cyanobacteria bacterium 13_1_40CM_2_61_4]
MPRSTSFFDTEKGGWPREPAFQEILGVDGSHRALEIAARRLHLDTLPPQAARAHRLATQLTGVSRDRRIEGYDAACVIEVVEHLDAARLAAFERALFEFARPQTDHERLSEEQGGLTPGEAQELRRLDMRGPVGIVAIITPWKPDEAARGPIQQLPIGEPAPGAAARGAANGHRGANVSACCSGT